MNLMADGSETFAGKKAFVLRDLLLCSVVRREIVIPLRQDQVSVLFPRFSCCPTKIPVSG